MRLTATLQRFNRMPNGNIFRGKQRLVKQVTPPYLRRLREQLEIEEKNMLLLRFPYLTEAQSFGHAKALGKPEAYKEKHQQVTQRIFKEDVTLYERLLHLRSNESWDN